MKDIVEILPDVGNMRQTVLPERNAEDAFYAQRMAEALNVDAQREENKKIQAIRAKRAGMDLQTYLTRQEPSTQATLDRDPKDDLKHWGRPLPENAQVRDKDGNVDIGERAVTIEEVSHIESIRRRPKNSTGQSEKSSAGEERKEAAENAFICSPGVSLENLNPEERARIQRPKPYEEPPVLAVETAKVAPAKDSWFKGGATWWANFWWKRRNKK